MKKNIVFVCFLLACLLVSGCKPAAPTASPSSTLSPAAVPTATSKPVLKPTETTQPAVSLLGPPAAVIFDDDGSPDGTTALLYLLSRPDVKLSAVSISYGEAYPDVYIQHIGRLLESFGILDIPLGAGQSAPLAGDNEFPEAVRESSNRFWDLPVPNPKKTYPVQEAASLMASTILASPEPVTLFISGPCTNLAQALRNDPAIKDNIASVFIMGGAVNVPGNIHDFLPEEQNQVAEWNVYADPQAAKEVFESGLNIYLVPLDATNLVSVGRDDTSRWRDGGPMADIAADFYDMLLTNWNTDQAQVWDVMTAAVMVEPDLCGFQMLPLQVTADGGSTDGQTAQVPSDKPAVNVCLQPDPYRIRQSFADVFAASPAEPGPVEVLAPTATPQNLVFRDDFTGALQPGWSWENEKPDHWKFTLHGWLQITAQDTALLYGQDQSNLLWRDLPSGNFTITVHLQAAPDSNFQQATIYLYESLSNYIALNRGYCGPCLEGGSGVYMEYKIGESFGSYNAAFSGTDLYLMLESKDQIISGFYAAEPDEWQRLGRFGNYFTFTRVGIGVTNSDMEGDDSSDLVGLFDYFDISSP